MAQNGRLADAAAEEGGGEERDREKQQLKLMDDLKTNTHRAKVYTTANGDAEWLEQGTGFVNVSSDNEEPSLSVVNERDTSMLLHHPVRLSHRFEAHGQSIITYHHPPLAHDIALSFAHDESCATVWQQLMMVQQELRRSTGGLNDADGAQALQDDVHGPECGSRGIPIGPPDPSSSTDMPHGNDWVAASSPSHAANDWLLETVPTPHVPGELPPVERERLRDVLAALSSEHGAIQYKDAIVRLLISERDYVSRLCLLFEECEQNNEIEYLGLLFKIFRALFNLADGTVVESLLDPSLISDVFGALEYDPELPSKLNHREWLQNSVRFKELVPIRNEETKSKIHQSYRMNYIKDVALARTLDEDALACLSAMVSYNNAEIAGQLYEDPHYFQTLFKQLHDTDIRSQEFEDLSSLLHELCFLGKQLSPGNRNTFFTALLKHGMLETLSKMISSGSEHAMDRATEVLIDCTFHDSAGLRTFLLKQSSNRLLSQLVEVAADPSAPGIQAQCIEVLMHVMDPTTMVKQSVERNGFLETFYDWYMGKLIDVISAGAACPPGDGQDDPISELRSISNPSKEDGRDHKGGTTSELSKEGNAAAEVPEKRSHGTACGAKPTDEVLLSLVDFLSFCIRNHGYRVKYFVLRNYVLERVMGLADRHEKHVVLGAIRFLRNCIGTEDDFFCRSAVRSCLFDGVWRAYMRHGLNKNNMVTSAVLELFRYITARNLKDLVAHLVERFKTDIDGLRSEPTLQRLRIRHFQNNGQHAAAEELARSLGIRVTDIDEEWRGGEHLSPSQTEQQYLSEEGREHAQHKQSWQALAQCMMPQAYAAATPQDRGGNGVAAFTEGSANVELNRAGTVRRRVRDDSMDEMEESYFEREESNEHAEPLQREQELPASGASMPVTPLRSPHGTSPDDDAVEQELVRPKPSKQRRKPTIQKISSGPKHEDHPDGPNDGSDTHSHSHGPREQQ